MRTATGWIKEHKVCTGLAAAAVLALSGLLWFRGDRADKEIYSEPLRKGPVIESVYGIGTVTATRSFQLKFGVTSTVRKIFVREGDPVRKGQWLVETDNELRQSAPFSGTVTFLPVKVGETVFPQSVILSLVDLADRYIVVSLEQRAALRVRQGQKARVSFDSMRGETYDGIVEAVYSNENNFLVRIGISGIPSQILPGMTADVGIAVSAVRDSLLVPVAAIDDGKVYVKRGMGKPKAVEVRTGTVDGAWAEIVAGELREGDQLYLGKKGGGKP